MLHGLGKKASTAAQKRKPRIRAGPSRAGASYQRGVQGIPSSLCHFEVFYLIIKPASELSQKSEATSPGAWVGGASMPINRPAAASLITSQREDLRLRGTASLQHTKENIGPAPVFGHASGDFHKDETDNVD
jgi:hypothetical protein